MNFAIFCVILFKTLPLCIDATFSPVEDGVPFHYQLEDYDEYQVPEDEDEIDEMKEINPFFLSHKTAVRIPLRVNDYTTADLYRDGYRQRKNCHPVLTNDYSSRKAGGRFLNNATDEQRLMCNLLQNYSKEARPVKNISSALVVNFSITINQIFELDDRNQQLVLSVWYEQTWKDEGLTWDPEKYNGLKTLNIPSYFIFIPDIELYNDGTDYRKHRMQFRTMVSSDGMVFYGNPVKLISSCRVNPTWYPFDTQICQLKFGSWSYTEYELDLQPSLAETDTSRTVTDGKWEILKVLKNRNSVKYTCCPDPYVDISYYLILRRKPLYYILSIYFFTVTQVGMTLAVYQLPIDSKEKCSLGSAVFFSISVFMLSCTEKLPEFSDYVPIINIYLFLIMAMSVTSLIITIAINLIYFQNKRGTSKIRRVPVWLLKLIRCHSNASWKSGYKLNKLKKKFQEKSLFIRKLRSYQQSLKSKTISDLVETDYLGDEKCENICNQIMEINAAIDILTDSYERKVMLGFCEIEWHELAAAMDRLMFWLFGFVLLCALSFLVGYSGFREQHDEATHISEASNSNSRSDITNLVGI